MDYNKIEDSIFKKAMEVFKIGASDFFGLNVSLKEAVNTELKNIDIKTNFLDYLFLCEDNNYIHFEFQTTNKSNDLKRFLYYDASLLYKEDKRIRTIVIYSSDIKEVKTSLNCGSIKYNIDAIYMKSFNGDNVLEIIKNKLDIGESLEEVDILSLSLVPLMNCSKNKSDITIESIDLANNIKEEQDKMKCLSMLYALFDKFGDEKAKKKFKEVVLMTDVGRMIYEDGLNEGLEKGVTVANTDTLLKQLTKRFKSIPSYYVEKVKQAPSQTIDVLLLDIFDLKEISDLDKYLN